MSAWPRASNILTGRADYLAANLAGALPDFKNPPNDVTARKEWLELRAIPHDLNMLPWLEENEEPLKLALAATARPSCVFPLGPRENCLGVEDLIGTEAHRRGLAGDLDGMFDCELALLRMSVHLRNHQFDSGSWSLEPRTLEVLARWWATRPGQTPERLRHAIAAIEKWQTTVPPPTDPIEARYVWVDRLLAFEPDVLAEEANARQELRNQPGPLRFHFKDHALGVLASPSRAQLSDVAGSCRSPQNRAGHSQRRTDVAARLLGKPNP